MKKFFNSIEQFFIKIYNAIVSIYKYNIVTKTIGNFIIICIVLSLIVGTLIGLCFLFGVFKLYAIIPMLALCILAISYLNAKGNKCQ